MKIYDVIIIGGGLSGSSTALHLSNKGYSVLIIEKNDKQNISACAGGMASSMSDFLPLNITEAIESKVNNVQFTWKSSDLVNANLSGESPFWIVKREKFDQLLLNKAIKQGTEIITGITVEKIEKGKNIWFITSDNFNIYKSKFLVIADGSNSIWPEYFGLGPKRPKYANTISLRLNELGDIPKYSVRFEFGLVKYGFAWAFPMEQSVNIGIGTFIGNKEIIKKELVQKVVKSFGFSEQTFEYKKHALRIWNGNNSLNSDGILVVGDAASLCDPFLAEGIRPSLLSSFYAAESIDKCFALNNTNLDNYSNAIRLKWGNSMIWGKRIAEVFYRFPRTGYQLGVKRKTAPKRIAQILSGKMTYGDIAGRVIKRLLFQKTLD